MQYLVAHMNGGSTCNPEHLDQLVGPFPTAIKASSWAYGQWGASTHPGGAVIRWRLKSFQGPAEIVSVPR